MLTLALATSVSPVLAVSLLAGFGAGGINPILGAVAVPSGSPATSRSGCSAR